jgi:thiamine-monophosphate kinase
VSVSEFDLIRCCLSRATSGRADVLLGIGDDCALLQPPAGQCLAVSMDTLVEGRHFAAGTDPASLGHKALAVNLSDLAAVGAEPAWATLSLTLPRADTAWLDAFMYGFATLAAEYRVQLVGGDTTRGPLSITLQLHGFVEPDKALRRCGASPGDRLCVSGTLGDAALALWRLQPDAGGQRLPEALRRRLDRPAPRVALGRLLRGRASAAIDVSDGLLADLGHLCESSGVGALIELSQLPLSGVVAAETARGNWEPVLAGGDDYELLFSVDPAVSGALLQRCRDAGHAVQEIGCLVDEGGITLVHPDGQQSKEIARGFDHFRA